MYKLYNVKNWGSLAIHCLLEEMGVPYTNIWMTVDQVRAPEYREINPLGFIPALGLSDGRRSTNPPPSSPSWSRHIPRQRCRRRWAATPMGSS